MIPNILGLAQAQTEDFNKETHWHPKLGSIEDLTSQID